MQEDNMKDTALCFRLVMNVLLLLTCMHVHLSYPQNAVYLQVDPNRLQFFEYDSIVLSCKGLGEANGWRVRRKFKGVNTICASSWEISTGPCTIKNAFGADGGEYWCEAKRGKRSSVVNITITAGSVILESPVLPVMDRHNVTLRCRTKQASSNVTAGFYKNGSFIRSSSTGEMTILSVSKSDEGLYKCSISGAGESPESWLTVRDTKSADSVNLMSPDNPVMKEDTLIVRCTKKSSFSLMGDYKDDLHLNTISLGEMIVHSVSASDEGLYKCSISGAGRSAESWLIVRALDKENHPFYNCSLWGFVVLRTVGTILLAALGLVVGLVPFRKPIAGRSTSPSCHPTSSPQTCEEHQSPETQLVTESSDT
ncbi:low affinity immunoglobulin gamma Fc region receptor III-A-like [Channa argus]|uniref:low affinity immunoglobulin gamma Fc region receptor III-A-like n=1 Tax=Channa argus TaxID=215402 RepID=UPI003521C0F2